MSAATTSTAVMLIHTRKQIYEPVRLGKWTIQRTELWNKSSKIIEHKLFTHSISGLFVTTGVNMLAHMRVCELNFHHITIYKLMFYHTGTDSTTFFLKFEWFDGVTVLNVQIMFSRKSNSETKTNIHSRIGVRFYRTHKHVDFSVFSNHSYSIFRSPATRC